MTDQVQPWRRRAERRYKWLAVTIAVSTIMIVIELIEIVFGSGERGYYLVVFPLLLIFASSERRRLRRGLLRSVERPTP